MQFISGIAFAVSSDRHQKTGLLENRLGKILS